MNKGFTLVELLAVVVILALLAYLTSIAVASIIKSSKEKLNETQVKIIEDATGMWLTDNLDLIPDAGGCIYITLGELKEYGALGDVKDLNTLESLDDNIIIKVTAVTDKKYNIEEITDSGSDEYISCTNNCTKAYE